MSKKIFTPLENLNYKPIRAGNRKFLAGVYLFKEVYYFYCNFSDSFSLLIFDFNVKIKSA